MACFQPSLILKFVTILVHTPFLCLFGFCLGGFFFFSLYKNHVLRNGVQGLCQIHYSLKALWRQKMTFDIFTNVKILSAMPN